MGRVGQTMGTMFSKRHVHGGRGGDGDWGQPISSGQTTIRVGDNIFNFYRTSQISHCRVYGSTKTNVTAGFTPHNSVTSRGAVKVVSVNGCVVKRWSTQVVGNHSGSFTISIIDLRSI